MFDEKQKEKILEQYDFYQNATKEIKEKIRNSALCVKLEKGQSFFNKGGECNVIALVGKGAVRVYVIAETGRETLLYRVEPGGSCPINIMTAIFDHPAPANAVIEQDIEAVVLPSTEFRKWINDDDSVRDFVFNSLINRFLSVMRLVEDLTSRRLDKRLAEFLLGRFDIIGEEPSVIKITHEQVASELGTAREVVSRLLNNLESMGTVALQRGAITLVNPEQLERIQRIK